MLTRSPRLERVLLGVAIVMFVVALVVGYLTLPAITGPIRWELLALVALAGTPGTVLFISLEYVLGARLLGLRVSVLEALRVSVLSSAANLLPLPGSVLVRTRELRRSGSSYRGALTTLAAIGVLWVGTAALFAAGFLAPVRPVLAVVTGGAGLLFVVMGAVLARVLSTTPGVGPLIIQVIGVELGATLIGTLRIFAVVTALGLPITLPQAATLQLAGVVATASGIFPSGLGLREALSGLVSPLIGLPVSVGLVSSAINRILDKLALLPAALVLFLRSRRASTPSARPADDADVDVVASADPEGARER
jgi:hypothetical protein